MKKRFTFQCWNCQETYTLFREITQGQEVIVACPYCHKEAIFDPSTYPRKKVVVALRGEGDTEREIEELVLPDVLPTHPPSPGGRGVGGEG